MVLNEGAGDQKGGVDHFFSPRIFAKMILFKRPSAPFKQRGEGGGGDMSLPALQIHFEHPKSNCVHFSLNTQFRCSIREIV